MIGIDLFCGAGGLSSGLEQSGIKIVAAVDRNFHACQTYKRNFPHTGVLCEDIENVDFRYFQGVDLVCGAPPCYGYSVGGLSQVDDPRNKLVMDFARAVQQIRPRYFIMEMVAGILRPQYKMLLDCLLSKFTSCNYQVTPLSILNVARYGVPQNRKRVIILGASKGLRPLNYPAPIDFKVTIRDAIGDLPKQGLEEVPAIYLGEGSEYAKNLRLSSGTLHNCALAEHSEAMMARFASVAPGKREPIGRQYRLQWSGVSPTLRSGSDGDRGRFSALLPLHPEENRMLSVREAARIHSYRDDFVFTAGRYHGAKQVGNSVPPLFATSIGLAIQGEVACMMTA